MQIAFKAAGLEFQAEVNYNPEIPARLTGHPDDMDEGEGSELEIICLSVGANDATFLLESNLRIEIEIAEEDAAKKFAPDLI